MRRLGRSAGELSTRTTMRSPAAGPFATALGVTRGPPGTRPRIALGDTRALPFVPAVSEHDERLIPVPQEALVPIRSDLLGSNGQGVIGQVLVGSIVAGIAAYVSVRFLTRYFATRTLTPFAVYCLVVGGTLLAWFSLHG